MIFDLDDPEKIKPGTFLIKVFDVLPNGQYDYFEFKLSVIKGRSRAYCSSCSKSNSLPVIYEENQVYYAYSQE